MYVWLWFVSFLFFFLPYIQDLLCWVSGIFIYNKTRLFSRANSGLFLQTPTLQALNPFLIVSSPFQNRGPERGLEPLGFECLFHIVQQNGRIGVNLDADLSRSPQLPERIEVKGQGAVIILNTDLARSKILRRYRAWRYRNHEVVL